MPRTCLTCRLTDNEVEFPKNRSYCKPCWGIQQAAYRAGRPDAQRGYRIKYKPKRRVYLDKNHAHIRATQDAYAEAHKDEIAAWRRDYEKTPEHRATRQAWEAQNKTHLKAYLRAYNAGRAEAQKAYMEIYYAEHPGQFRTYSATRRARMAALLVNDLTWDQWLEILAAFDHRCAYCPPTCRQCQRHTHHLHQDHIIPISKGGNHRNAREALGFSHREG